MTTIFGIDVSKYKAVEPLSNYGEIHILNTGKLRLTEPLTDDIIAFLKTIAADVSLWDGSKGVLGRAYLPSITAAPDLTKQELEEVRSRYEKVKVNLAESARLEKLKNELDMNTRMQTQLNMSVFEMEQKVSDLKKAKDDSELENGEQSEKYKSLETKVIRLLDELRPCKQAADRIDKKVQQTRVDIAESETGFLRRVAVLRRIFANGTVTALLHNDSEDDELVKQANEAEENACATAIKLQQSKRFYIDSRTGLAHLFQTETILKAILENLREGMNSLQGRPDSARQIPLETGFEYRIGYVRKLWSRAETAFKEALPYIKHTSLKHTRGSMAQEDPVEQGKLLKFSRQASGSGSGGKKVGIFESSPVMLRKFSKVELSHPISRRSRISALYKSAGRAYKDMNELYDFHERMTREAFTLLQTIDREDQRANDQLLDVCESLLERPLLEKSQDGS